MKTAHYYIDAWIDGDCLDLIVEAQNERDALELWRAYFLVTPEDVPAGLRLFKLAPLSGESRVLGWACPSGMQRVA